MGAINTLGLAKRTKSKILQASTSEVYGDPEVHPQNEAYWGMSIHWDQEHAMMKGRDVRKLCL